MNNKFIVYANGQTLDINKSFQDYNMSVSQKILLIPEQKASKPQGVRFWTQFTTYRLDDSIYESDHSLCFTPSFDISWVGVAFFRILSTEASSQDMSIYWRVFDEANTTKLSEGELRSMKLKYDHFKPDDNKIIKFNFTNEFT